MDALGAELARDRLRKNALRRLGRSETCEQGLAALGGRVAGDKDRSAFGFHVRHGPPRDMVERHDVDPEIGFEHRGIDIQEIPERAAHRVMYDRLDRAAGGCRLVERGMERVGIANVAGKGETVRNLARQRIETADVAGQHGDAVAAFRIAPHQRGPVPGPTPVMMASGFMAGPQRGCDKFQTIVAEELLFADEKVGAPKMPRSAASALTAASSAAASALPRSPSAATSMPAPSRMDAISPSLAIGTCDAQTALNSALAAVAASPFRRAASMACSMARVSMFAIPGLGAIGTW
jgi:hypothetical protein